ncbi:ribbon-helix-helix protein, CopG family [Parasphingorhabdus cellanae]|uniref:CopG family transcriptional regulator n=1 Tax=Parasphingorhabdus cellanae TaxID=2806553 RepID=A0ABX7T4S5_9SPHN|nr:ribbon-helix-helix protein, CopG family [Parasphingorhabdus cellanae]QTD56536.1 CopG family transcriptional regulator [Parasphingorhabdus cellanae]
MTRILADLPEEDVEWLDALASEQGKSRAALLREAVEAFRARESQDGIAKYFGLWARHGSHVDGLDYDGKVRSDWDGVRE